MGVKRLAAIPELLVTSNSRSRLAKGVVFLEIALTEKRENGEPWGSRKKNCFILAPYSAGARGMGEGDEITARLCSRDT
jgi:hypothetical protein